ncbi:MAG: DUF1016 N-terminal domain-containing protein [Bacteroidota bacterium]|nr:DUF1016 N-terminal domain-containing protein [Bacteroidota bacterium]
MKIDKLINRIQLVDSRLKNEANNSVNQLLTIRNWMIGYHIVEYEQFGEDRAKYGDRLLKTLSEKLSKKEAKGFSYTNLSVYRQFSIVFPEILRTVSEDSSSILRTVSEELSQTQNLIEHILPEQIKMTGQISQTISNFSEGKVLLASKMMQSLSFSHITLLLPINDDLKRAFYTIEAIKGTWSFRELKRQI